MQLFRFKKILGIFILLTALSLTACSSPSSSEFAQADRESRQQTTITAESGGATAVAGGKLNKFFPQPGNGYDVVYSQEKEGFAQAKWKKDGKELALMSISDTANNPAAAQKYANSTSQIKGFPAASQGSKGTGVLVNDRFQVKVLSRDASFSESDREALLAQFDLVGLQSLAKPVSLAPTQQSKKATKKEFQDVQKESSKRKATAVAKEAIQGAKFNKFFPQPGNGYDVVFSQEKQGFAQAKLKKSGKEMAIISVSDIISTPASAKKYASSQEKIKGYPVANQGKKGTGVLVSDRLQVKVLSRDAAFSESDRKDWLQQFDLSGLAGLVQ